MKYYIAYGSNLSLEQMAKRCPNAIPVGTGILKNWRLVFRYHATIEPYTGEKVPVGIWKIEDGDEKLLDAYEGYPSYYDKRNMWLMIRTFDGHHKLIRGMVYVMNQGQPIIPPTLSYYRGIKDGYSDFRLNHELLLTALHESIERHS